MLQTNSLNNRLVDPTWDIIGDDDQLAFKYDQEIPSDFLSSLSDLRTSSANSREGNFMKACSVPVAVHEKWLREGFNLYEETPARIIARLKAEDLSHFIATSKSL